MRQREEHERRSNLRQAWRHANVPEALPMKSFKQVFTNIPELENYNIPQDESYWKHWEKKTYEDLQPVKSWIDPKALYNLAKELGKKQYW